MISRKLQRARFIDFSPHDLDLRSALNMLRGRRLEAALKIDGLSAFDRYILKVFFDGITPEDTAPTTA